MTDGPSVAARGCHDAQDPWGGAKDMSECMDEACRCLTLVGSNLCGLLQDLSRPPDCLSASGLQSDVARLEGEAESLGRNLEGLLSGWAQQAEGMAGRAAEAEELRAKVLSLQRENDKACAQLAIAQSDNVRMRAQLTNQSAFCASLGSVLGNLVWKASRVPPVVDLLLTGTKAADFLCIVSGTLESFLETFNTEMPGPSADESQFIMAMGGIVTNMAAAAAGRQFLVTDPNGRDLIQQIVRVLPVIPTPSGNCLKRLLLMALYNVSINQAGLSLLHEDGKGAIFSVVKDCIKPESTNELRLMAMRLLLSLTCEIHDPSLILQVPKEFITQVANSDDLQLKSMAQEVMENILKAEERLKLTKYKNSGMYQLSGSIEKSPHAEVDIDGVETTDKKRSLNTAAWRLPTHP